MKMNTPLVSGSWVTYTNNNRTTGKNEANLQHRSELQKRIDRERERIPLAPVDVKRRELPSPPRATRVRLARTRRAKHSNSSR